MPHNAKPVSMYRTILFFSRPPIPVLDSPVGLNGYRCGVGSVVRLIQSSDAVGRVCYQFEGNRLTPNPCKLLRFLNGRGDWI